MKPSALQMAGNSETQKKMEELSKDFAIGIEDNASRHWWRGAWAPGSAVGTFGQR